MFALILTFADFLYSVFIAKSLIDDDDDVAIFDLPRDTYNGVTLDTSIDTDSLDDRAFRRKLAKSLEIWESTEVCAVTIYVRLIHSSFVPICVSLGFEFHHARPDYVFMLKWLPTHRPSKFPKYGNTFIGAGGLVVNENEEILVVQERYLRNPHWKLPGGFSEPGEGIDETAVREVMEETGIETEFVCILAFRHLHGYHFGCSDLYFVCLLRPLREGMGNDDITREESEISQCRWMPIDEYVSSPLVSTANSFIAERYLKLRGNHNHLPPLQIPNGFSPPQLAIPPQHQNYAYHDQHHHLHHDDDDNPDSPLLNHDNHRHPPPQHPHLPLPQPPQQLQQQQQLQHVDYAIVRTLVPSYDGATMNSCYSVDRLDLDQI